MIVWLHLSGGKTLACRTTEAEAVELRDTVRARWHTPDPHHPDIAFGETELHTWVRVADISAVEIRHDEVLEAP